MSTTLKSVGIALLLQPSAGLIVGVRPSYACASRAGTPSAVTLPGKLLAGGSACLLWWQRLRTSEKKSERFAGMEWADAPDSLDADGCELLGVEGDQGCAPAVLSAPRSQRPNREEASRDRGPPPHAQHEAPASAE